MQRLRFPLAVALTSLVLVSAIVAVGGLMVGSALAQSPFGGPFGGGRPGPWSADGGWQHANLPPELAGLADVPASERFSHLRSVQVHLTDKNNAPLDVQVTPGTAKAVNATSLDVATNDGADRTFTLDDHTIQHGKTIAPNDKVVVVTLNGSATATAVMTVDPNGFGPRGPFGH